MMSLPIAVSFVCYWSVHVCLKRPGLRARSGCPSSSALVSLPRPDVGPAQQQRAYPALSPLPGGAGSERSRPQPHLWRLCGGRAHRLVRGGQPGGTRGGSAHPDPACPSGGRGRGPALLPGRQLLGPFVGAAAGRDWHGQPDRRRQCGAAAFWPQGWGHAGGAERHIIVHRRAGPWPRVQRAGAAAGSLPDHAAVFADPGDGGLRHRGAGVELAQRGEGDGGRPERAGWRPACWPWVPRW